MSHPFKYLIFEAEPDTWFFLRHAQTIHKVDLPEMVGGPCATLDDAADAMVFECGSPGDICGISHHGFEFLRAEQREELLGKIRHLMPSGMEPG